MIYCSLDIFSQPVTIQFSLILLDTRMRSVPYNINRTIWENTERSRDAEIFNKKYQNCNKYIYIIYIGKGLDNGVSVLALCTKA